MVSIAKINFNGGKKKIATDFEAFSSQSHRDKKINSKAFKI